jgi:hypothetical protein
MWSSRNPPEARRSSQRSQIHLHDLPSKSHAGASVSNVKWSKAQKANRKRMRYLNQYAKAAMADPQVRAEYEARAAKEGRVPYNVALSDYWQGKNLLSK